MNVTNSFKEENDYLLIESSGSIADIEEYQLHTKRHVDEIMKYGIKKIIVDESKIQWAKSLLLQSDIVDFYSDELPEEMRFWKVACVVDSEFIDIVKFWEFKANQSGYNYKAYTSIEEARKFMSD